jgi:hypothetical protein
MEPKQTVGSSIADVQPLGLCSERLLVGLQQPLKQSPLGGIDVGALVNYNAIQQVVLGIVFDAAALDDSFE